MARSTVAVRFTGDASNLKSSIGQVDKGLGGLGSRASKFSTTFKSALTVGAGAAVLKFGSTVVSAGSDLDETLSKSNTVFGKNAEAIEAWASKASTKIGQSKQQALEAASSFGNMFTQLGIGEEQAAGMSTQMTELASDFASFHNADITEVLTAQQAAFRGEYDAVQRFVPTINAAAVEQKALAMTGKRTTKELTQQEKALATQALMMEGAGDAAGDFARTSDGLANKQRILSAKFGDMQAKIGQALIPVLLRLMEIGEGIVRFFAGLSPQMQAAIGIAAGLAAALFLIVKAVKAWQAAQLALNVVLTANPIGLIIAAIAAFIAGLVLAYQKVGWFRAFVDKSFAVVKAVIVGVFTWVKNNWPLLLAIITGPIGLAVLAIVKHWDTIKAGVTAVKNWIVSTFDAVLRFLGGLGGRISGAATAAWNGLKNGLREAVDWILRQIDRALGPIDEIAGKLGGLVGKISDVAGSVGGVLGKIPGFASGVTNFGGGLAVVGEEGPELVNLPRGSDVIPMSGRMSRASGAGGNTYVTVHVAGSVLAERDLIALINRAERKGTR